MSLIFLDIECYRNFFYIGMKRQEDGLRKGLEFSERHPAPDRDWVRSILLRNTTVGFNSLTYDLPMIWYFIAENPTPEQLKIASDKIIKGNLKPWDTEKMLGIRIPWDIRNRHIDLIEPQPNAVASLKSLNGRMHGKRLQDLPYHESTILTHEQMDAVADYCLVSDLDATEFLWNTLKEPMELREALGAIHGKDFRSKSDAQIGEQIVKLQVEKLTGIEPKKAPMFPGTKFKYPVPDYVRFEKPELRDMLARLRETEFEVNPEGKADLPKWLDGFTVTIGQTTYAMGIGGLHSTESNRAVHSDEDFSLIDADVASQYPSIIMSLGLAPLSLGKDFLTVYNSIMQERLRAKARAKQIKDELPGVNDPDRIAELKAELLRCQVIDKGGKIQLNGVYGKLGSKYSILHAPHLLISVTLTGQLTLLMLAEMAEKSGIQVVSGNTDGVLFRCPRSKFAGLNKDRLHPSALADVTDEWERLTGFKLEFAEYKAIYNQSVNTYYAIKANGGHKRKGPIGNPWSKHPDDFDPVRGQLMKNPQMTICSDAALARIKDGIPVEETIRACRDIRQFVTVIKASKGATWRGNYLGKTVRYYWAVGGNPITKAEPNEKGNFDKIPKTDGARECMTLPDDFPDDIDYEKYIAEAEDILKEVGFYGPIKPPEKRIRITKANRFIFNAAWAALT